MFIVRLLHSVDIFPVKCFSWESKFKLEVSFKGIKVQEIKRRTARFKITVKSCCVTVRKRPTVAGFLFYRSMLKLFKISRVIAELILSTNMFYAEL